MRERERERVRGLVRGSHIDCSWGSVSVWVNTSESELVFEWVRMSKINMMSVNEDWRITGREWVSN